MPRLPILTLSWRSSTTKSFLYGTTNPKNCREFNVLYKYRNKKYEHIKGRIRENEPQWERRQWQATNNDM